VSARELLFRDGQPSTPRAGPGHIFVNNARKRVAANKPQHTFFRHERILCSSPNPALEPALPGRQRGLLFFDFGRNMEAQLAAKKLCHTITHKLSYAQAVKISHNRY
jgi:hypothetical protein